MTNSLIFASLPVLIGIIVGILVCHILFKQDEKPIVGEIQIDHSDKDTDIFRIVWYEDPSKLTRETYVTFKVDPNANLREKGNDYNE